MIVSFSAGGTADTLGRIIAAELSQAFNQQFYVQNKPGDSGATGSSEVARADPDGYTLLIAGAGPQLVGPAINSNITYDTMRDFTHIAMIAGDSNMLAATPSLGVHTFAEFMEIARDKPITCGSPGAGTQGELIQEIVNRTVGIKLQPIPFRSAGDAMTELIGGHIQAALLPSISVGEYVTAGRAVGLAVAAEERLEAYNNVPTFKELGYDVRGTSWFWLAGPSKMPADVVDKLNAAVQRIIGSPKISAQFAKSALSTRSLDAAQTKALIADEVNLWGSTAKDVGFKIQ
jgi:tripartite-type tricarboxylate transporter receptor subunit TctC